MVSRSFFISGKHGCDASARCRSSVFPFFPLHFYIRRNSKNATTFFKIFQKKCRCQRDGSSANGTLNEKNTAALSSENRCGILCRIDYEMVKKNHKVFVQKPGCIMRLDYVHTSLRIRNLLNEWRHRSFQFLYLIFQSHVFRFHQIEFCLKLMYLFFQ